MRNAFKSKMKNHNWVQQEMISIHSDNMMTRKVLLQISVLLCVAGDNKGDKQMHMLCQTRQKEAAICAPMSSNQRLWQVIKIMEIILKNEI